MIKRLIDEYSDALILALAAVGLVFSHALMSFSLVFMLLRVLFCNHQRLKTAPKTLLAVMLSFFALMLVGCLWSKDLEEALRQLNKNLPFLIVPLYFFTIPPFDKKKTQYIAALFVLSVVAGSLIGLVRLFFFDYADIRIALNFSSHIRFALFVCLIIGFACIYLLQKANTLSKRRLIATIGLIVYLTGYLVASSSLTGVVILLVLFVPVSLWHCRKKTSHKFFAIYALLVAAGVCTLAWYVVDCARDYFVPKQEKVENGFIENGYYCYSDNTDEMQQQKAQMEKGLEKYLSISADSLFQDGEYRYSYTDIACRYFNSKGLSRTLESWNNLSKEDLTNIQKGIPNYVYACGNPLKVRLYKTFFEFESYRKWGKIKGSSLIQKTELWQKTAMICQKDCNWLHGVGTGGLKGKLNRELVKHSSPLSDSNLMPHNQFLSVYASWGLIGLAVFGIWLLYPAFATNLNKSAYYLWFFGVIAISMLSEDTLDNQQGIMLFSIVNTFLICHKAERDKKAVPLQR